ncbi:MULTISPECIES: acyl carrier protein [Pseudomonas]|uniref:Phosphopantetheine-containing protein n=1 Tax=Pseudomonas asplenii TaxID=53407 RepID=A0A0M9GIZ0_9PSED|nr:acyl carrier protein [Pseudomonas fuscovaginae]KPA92128.1 phosphopantetheine-containing protein [Pseudomonas fuscovaginae]KPA97992.1 phosphopantetheine-containing protein [Pseudomonas fuscovaginae]
MDERQGTLPEHVQLLADVLRLCAELLAVPSETLSAQHNFFELGGNSLKALQLCALLEQRYPQLAGESGIELTRVTSSADLHSFAGALLDDSRQFRGMTEGEL